MMQHQTIIDKFKPYIDELNSSRFYPSNFHMPCINITNNTIKREENQYSKSINEGQCDRFVVRSKSFGRVVFEVFVIFDSKNILIPPDFIFNGIYKILNNTFYDSTQMLNFLKPSCQKSSGKLALLNALNEAYEKQKILEKQLFKKILNPLILKNFQMLEQLNLKNVDYFLTSKNSSSFNSNSVKNEDLEAQVCIPIDICEEIKNYIDSQVVENKKTRIVPKWNKFLVDFKDAYFQLTIAQKANSSATTPFHQNIEVLDDRYREFLLPNLNLPQSFSGEYILDHVDICRQKIEKFIQSHYHKTLIRKRFVQTLQFELCKNSNSYRTDKFDNKAQKYCSFLFFSMGKEIMGIQVNCSKFDNCILPNIHLQSCEYLDRKSKLPVDMDFQYNIPNQYSSEYSANLNSNAELLAKKISEEIRKRIPLICNEIANSEKNVSLLDSLDEIKQSTMPKLKSREQTKNRGSYQNESIVHTEQIQQERQGLTGLNLDEKFSDCDID